MSDDLVAFLRARHDDDERWARAALPEGGEESLASRVLRAVEADRAILDEHREGDFEVCRRCHHAYPCATLRHLGAVYDNRPDYRPEWKP